MLALSITAPVESRSRGFGCQGGIGSEKDWQQLSAPSKWAPTPEKPPQKHGALVKPGSATAPARAIITSSREAVLSYYSGHERRTADMLDSGGWRAVRSALHYDESTAGPDGRKGVLKLVEDRTPANTHDMRLNYQIQLAEPKRVVFAFVKPAGRADCALWLYGKDGRVRAQASFSLESGQAHTVGAVGGGWSNTKAGMVQIRDKWWWIWLTGETDDPAAPEASLLLSAKADGSVIYDGDGVSGVHVFDARIERQLSNRGW